MKLKGLLWGACACAMLAGCSNDDVAVDNGNINANPDGESYMYVQLVASNDGMSRATVGNPEFEDGDETEGKNIDIASANFYFYDANGGYVTKGQIVGDLTIGEETENASIEYVSNAVVVLNNVTVTPNQVLAVLNGNYGTAGDPFVGKSLSDAMDVLSDGSSSYSYTSSDKTYFKMSSSTYNGSTVYKNNAGDAVSLATVSTTNLQSTAELAKDHPVEIYVERLAAKVQVAKSSNIKIDDISNVSSVIDGTTSDNTTLEITVDKWGLSAVNKTAYVVKRIDPTWSFTGWTDWNDAENYRSYWAKDPNYNNGTYPTDYAAWMTNGGSDAADYNAENDNNSLEYLSYADLNKSAESTSSDVAYCLENTVNKTILGYDNTAKEPNTSAVTHVLIAATMKVKGGTAQDLINYKGVYYKVDDYKKAALTDWKNLGTTLYKKTEDGQNATYTEIGLDDIVIVDLHAGKVTIGLSEDALGETWYTDNNGTDTKYEGDLSEVFDALSEADGFKEGKMYYCVPIEHLNTTAGEEGSYGVVRNHWYKLSLDAVSGLGTAVWNPEETIIPNYEPETYYVAARLNILAWHMVSQSVTLK